MELRVICIVAQCIVSATALKFEATRRAPTRRAPTRETRRYHQGHAHDFSDHEYRGSTMRLLSEVTCQRRRASARATVPQVKAVDVDKWLSAQKDEAVCGVYALYDGGPRPASSRSRHFLPRRSLRRRSTSSPFAFGGRRRLSTRHPRRRRNSPHGLSARHRRCRRDPPHGLSRHPRRRRDPPHGLSARHPRRRRDPVEVAL